MSATTNAATYLDDLATHLRTHYCGPDVEAIEIVLAAVAAHYVQDADPLWLFVEAPPGTGKTELAIFPLQGLPKVWPISDITPNTFLSGWDTHGEGKRNVSLLAQVGESAIFVIKDFTTFMSKKPEDRAAIIGQIRELWDGQFTKFTGKGTQLSWKGKITIIAATTPAIEREWALLRDLGERFMTVRWPRGNGVALATHVLSQNGSHLAARRIAGEYVQKIMAHVPLVGKLPLLPEHLIPAVAAMSEFGACARGRVIRDSMGKRDIIQVNDPEGPTRFAKALAHAVSAYALLRHRPIEDGDMRIAKRLLYDSIPHTRMKLLTAIPPNAPIAPIDIQRMTGMPLSTIAWTGAEMRALGLLREVVSSESEYEYTDKARELLATAAIP